MKCTLCSQSVEITFLSKPLGTVVKDAKGKKHLVCASCQKKHTTKDDILNEISSTSIA